jgi:hypothetical protein
LFVAKKTRETNHAILTYKFKILGNFAARWKCTSTGSDSLNGATQFDLFDEQRIASFAVVGAFVWEMSFVRGDELRCWSKRLFRHGISIVDGRQFRCTTQRFVFSKSAKPNMPTSWSKSLLTAKKSKPAPLKPKGAAPVPTHVLQPYLLGDIF